MFQMVTDVSVCKFNLVLSMYKMLMSSTQKKVLQSKKEDESQTQYNNIMKITLDPA